VNVFSFASYKLFQCHNFPQGAKFELVDCCSVGQGVLVLDLELDLELRSCCESGNNFPDEKEKKEMLKAPCRRGDGCLPCRLRAGNLEHVVADSDSDSGSCSEAEAEAEVWVWVWV
jgi:hypothetical protein